MKMWRQKIPNSEHAAAAAGAGSGRGIFLALSPFTGTGLRVDTQSVSARGGQSNLGTSPNTPDQRLNQPQVG